ncbi:MAG: ATP-binding protein [Lapillicoccus sp.]
MARKLRSALVLAGCGGVVVATAAALLPQLAFLRSPDVASLLTGLVLIGCGLVLAGSPRTGVVGWLVVGGGVSWFLPDLAVTGVDVVDTVLLDTSLLHVAFMVHAALVTGALRPAGSLRQVAVALGYAAALSASTGGYEIVLPAAGLATVVAAVGAVGALRGTAAGYPLSGSRALAALPLGVGLVTTAVARLLVGPPVEPALVRTHELVLMGTALLLCATSLRRPTWGRIDVTTTTGLAELEQMLADRLGVPQLDVALADGSGGWLDTIGRPRPPSVAGGLTVRDESGLVSGVLAGDAVATGRRLDPMVVDVVTSAARNARLRQAVTLQVEELEASRRRLVLAADTEAAALQARLRSGVLSCLATIRTDLEHDRSTDPTDPTEPGPAPTATATAVRWNLERTIALVSQIGRGLDPLAGNMSLAGALAELAAAAPIHVTVLRCVEPGDLLLARTVWFCCAEAVNNATKHSRGTEVHISVDRDAAPGRPERVVVLISDDGVGGADPEGRGLRGFYDRVEALGGTVHLESPWGGGTQLHIVLPSLPPAADELGPKE